MMNSKRLLTIVGVALVILSACGKSPEERAENHLKRGKEFIAKGDDVRGRIELSNALQFKNNLVEAWKALTEVDERAKNWSGVYAASMRIAELDAKDADSRMRLARLSLLARKFDDALKFATEAVEINSKNTNALALRAAVLLRLQDNKAAIQEANTVLTIDPSNVEAVFVLATEKLSRGDASGALSDLKELSSEAQSQLGAALLRIRIYEAQKDLAGIEAELRKLVAVNPEESSYAQQLIRFYLANKRAADAESLVRMMAAKAPDSTASGLEVVRLVGGLRGAQAARAELTSLIESSMGKYQYKIALAELDFTQGRADDARAGLNAVIREASSRDAVVAARLKLAEMDIASRQYNSAITQTDQVLAVDARNTAALRIRASAKIQIRELEGAITDARAALNDQPRSAELLTILALAYERGGRIEMADKQLADAMRSSNYNPQWGLNYVNFLNRRGLREHAESVITELANRNPDNVSVLSSLAQVKLAKKDWAGAQNIADRIKSVSQASSTIEQIEVAALTGQNKLGDGVAALQALQKDNPASIRPIVSLARAHLQAGQPEKAEELLNSVIDVNASNAEVYVLLGLTSRARNRTEEAVYRFQKAIAVQPKSPLGYRSLAEENARSKKWNDAIKVIDDGLKVIPNDFDLRQFKASVLEQNGDINGAISLYEQLLKERPGSMIVANNFASLLSDHRTDKDSIESAYVAALVLAKSDVPQFQDTLGWLYYLRGDYRNARSLLEQAIGAMPNSAVVCFHLGMTYKALGEHVKAREQLKMAADLEPNAGVLRSRISAALEELTKAGGG